MSSSPPPESRHGEEAEGFILNPVKPEEAAADGAIINIKVTSQTAPDVMFRVKRGIKLQRIIDQYCGKYSLDPRAVVFLNDEGKHLRAVQTAEEAGLEDGSSIDVHLHSNGGGGRVGDASTIDGHLNQQGGSGRTSV